VKKNRLINKARREKWEREEGSSLSFSVLNPPAPSIIFRKQGKKY